MTGFYNNCIKVKDLADSIIEKSKAKKLKNDVSVKLAKYLVHTVDYLHSDELWYFEVEEEDLNNICPAGIDDDRTEEAIEYILEACVRDRVPLERGLRIYSKLLRSLIDFMNKNTGPFGFHINKGVSKFVIVPDVGNYVIKIPFTGTNEFFESAPLDSDWDYCLAEIRMYNQTIDDKFKKYFAKTIYVGNTLSGYPIYIQEKAMSFEDMIDDIMDNVQYLDTINTITKEYKKEENKEIHDRIEDIFVDGSPAPCDWAYLLCDDYDRNGGDVSELLDFFGENPILTEDLHEGNVGFTVTGEPVIFDYTSFNK